MTAKSITRMFVMFSFLVFISAVDTSINRAFGQTCSAEADSEIVASIYAKIKANSKLAEQVSHINVSSTNKVVKLQGWTDSEADFDSVYQYALKTSCVSMVNAKDLRKAKPSEDEMRSICSSGTKPCGDICIPDNDTCNISGGNTKQE